MLRESIQTLTATPIVSDSSHRQVMREAELLKVLRETDTTDAFRQLQWAFGAPRRGQSYEAEDEATMVVLRQAAAKRREATWMVRRFDADPIKRRGFKGWLNLDDEACDLFERLFYEEGAFFEVSHVARCSSLRCPTLTTLTLTTLTLTGQPWRGVQA